MSLGLPNYQKVVIPVVEHELTKIFAKYATAIVAMITIARMVDV